MASVKGWLHELDSSPGLDVEPAVPTDVPYQADPAATTVSALHRNGT